MTISSVAPRDHNAPRADPSPGSLLTSRRGSVLASSEGGEAFDGDSVKWVRFAQRLKSLKQRLLESGWLTQRQMSSRLGVARTTLGRWRQAGRIKARICNDNGEWLYWPPSRGEIPSATRTTMVKDSSTARGAV